MNGASALDCENTISNPNRMNITTIGVSQYFFSCLSNCSSSETTPPLPIVSLLRGSPPGLSVHPRIVCAIAVAIRVRRPTLPFVASPGQRIGPDHFPHQAQRHEGDREQQRQQDSCVDVTECPGNRPPD